MNDVPTAECASEYNRNNSAKVVLERDYFIMTRILHS